jgi:tRNA threonylcarbamoyladenosine biosynthesis protein TsaB
LILSIDTSTKVCSIALVNENGLVSEQNFFLEKSHSTLIPSSFDFILSNSGITKNDLKAIALSDGPGSYTGLRIGTSAAKGLCYALDIPLISVNTLYAMAWEANKSNTNGALLVPMLDARRMEVYTMVLNKDLDILEDTQALVIDDDSFLKYKEKEMILFGNGAVKTKKHLEINQNMNWWEHIYTSARSVGEIAQLKFQKEQFEDLAYYEPNYLKEFQAIKPKALI